MDGQIKKNNHRPVWTGRVNAMVSMLSRLNYWTQLLRTPVVNAPENPYVEIDDGLLMCLVILLVVVIWWLVR